LRGILAWILCNRKSDPFVNRKLRGILKRAYFLNETGKYAGAINCQREKLRESRFCPEHTTNAHRGDWGGDRMEGGRV